MGKLLPFKIIILLIFFVSSSCSSVKVLDAWKSDKIAEIKNNNFLIIARANNSSARIAFEDEIVRQMESNGYKATSSFTKFGDIKPNKPEAEIDREKLKKIFKEEGFNAVILTVMKELKKETRVKQEGGYYEGSHYYTYYPRVYGRFYPYYYNRISYYSAGNYVEREFTTSTDKTYILETTIYNLEASGENQLVAVVTSQIENPETASNAAKEFVKQVSKKFR